MTPTGLEHLVNEHGAWANIPPRRNRNDALCFSPYLYRARNLVERFFNKIKQCRRVATRYDKLAANYLAFIQLASIRLWLRVHESTPLNLFKDGIPRAELQAVSGLYRRYRATAFQMRYVWISAALGVIAFVLFVYLHFSRDYAYWWGHEQHGVAGLVFAVSVGVMVSAGVWGLIIVVFGSWMLAKTRDLANCVTPVSPGLLQWACAVRAADTLALGKRLIRWCGNLYRASPGISWHRADATGVVACWPRLARNSGHCHCSALLGGDGSQARSEREFGASRSVPQPSS